jgi:hypothetical protein
VSDAETEPDFAILPAELQPLIPLIRKYAESDDVARSDLLAAASSDELGQVTSLVSPHWEAINSFLDANMSPPGPHQDVAVALDSFAQAAIEAQYELQNRSEK